MSSDRNAADKLTQKKVVQTRPKDYDAEAPSWTPTASDVNSYEPGVENSFWEGDESRSTKPASDNNDQPTLHTGEHILGPKKRGDFSTGPIFPNGKTRNRGILTKNVQTYE